MTPSFHPLVFIGILIAVFVASSLLAFFIRRYALHIGVHGIAPSGTKVALWGGVVFLTPLMITAPFLLDMRGGQALVFFLAFLALILFGLLDDIVLFPPLPQFGLQAIVAGALVLAFASPFGKEYMAWGIAALLCAAFIFSMNALNWLDGLDGLAASTSAVAFASVAFFLFIAGQGSIGGILGIALAGLVAFLFWNMAPARLYMGTAGSMGLGLFAAFIPATHMEWAPLFLAAFALPISHATWVVLQRLWAHVLPWQGGDRRHLHYRLQDAGWSNKKILLLFGGATLVFVLAGNMAELFSISVLWRILFSISMYFTVFLTSTAKSKSAVPVVEIRAGTISKI